MLHTSQCTNRCSFSKLSSPFFHQLRESYRELKDAELNELDELRLRKTSASLAKELTQIRQMEQIVTAHEELMSRVEQFFTENAKEGNDVI